MLDLAAAILDGLGRLLAWLPGFVVHYLVIDPILFLVEITGKLLFLVFVAPVLWILGLLLALLKFAWWVSLAIGIVWVLVESLRDLGVVLKLVALIALLSLLPCWVAILLGILLLAG